ncbi:alpha/beta hydrolase [Haloplanus sp. C73]|uniref:alpha/beta hydrolase n=1 Tax=Haloplanus sp. C73 TaxID=3421641 RepID=UPI003EBF811B
MTAGTDPESAEAAVLLLHGRDATAETILGMASELHRPGLTFLAPQAPDGSWYPQSALAPAESNEPQLSASLATVEGTLSRAQDVGIPTDRTLLLGFSQGACLASEFAARNPTRYGGVVALSGGLLGDVVDAEAYDGDLSRTPAFFGCSDDDPHVPEERVHASVDVYERLGADVTARIYEGVGHSVTEDELDALSTLVADL